MAGREVREYTNLTDPKDKKLGKGKDKMDDEDITFQRMVAKMQEVAGERGGYLHGRGAASLADSSPASVPLAFRVEPKPKSGIRQQDLLKKVVEIKPKRPRTDGNQSTPVSSNVPVTNHKPDHDHLKEKERSLSGPKKAEQQSLSGSKKVEEHTSCAAQEAEAKPKIDDNSGGGLLGLAYTSSDDDE